MEKGRFLFGTATAAYQIEGAVTEDGRGQSIWDEFSHKKGNVRNDHTGDVACDTYRRYPEDIGLMKSLGVQAYRFSIAWSRIFPEGRGRVNEAGLAYYERLVDSLLEAGILPFPTLYHWDLPLALQKEYGGFLSRRCADDFARYVETVVKRLGDRVKNWITLNEPFEHALFGHFFGSHAPGKKSIFAYFKVACNQLLAHGMALDCIRAYSPDCEAGITLSLTPVHPASEREEDRKAAILANQFMNNLFFDPVLKGRFPEPFWKKTSLLHGKVSADDLRIISHPVDFVGINYYSREFAYKSGKVPLMNFWVTGSEMAEREFFRFGRQHCSMGWEVWPDGMREVLTLMKEEYGNPKVYITENGVAYADEVVGGKVYDGKRIDFLEQYLGRLEDCLKKGCNVQGYFYWSLLDNFEWAGGYDKRFGLVYVDFATQKRILKESGRWYADYIARKKPLFDAELQKQGAN